MFDLTTKQGVLDTIADLRDGGRDQALTKDILAASTGRKLTEIANKNRLCVWHEVDGRTDAQAGADEFVRCTSIPDLRQLMLSWVEAYRRAELLTADEFEKVLPNMKFDG